MNTACLLLSLLLFTSCELPQGDDAARRDVFKADTLPIELREFFHALDTLLTSADKERLRQTTPDSTALYHFSLGMNIRNEFGLWRQGPLYSYLAGHGLNHPDDMSGVLIDIYGDYLRGEAIDIPAAIRRIPPAPAPEDFIVLPSADSTSP